MSLVRWNPAKELQDMQKRFDAFFGQEFPLSSHEQMARTEWSPAVDIAETPEGYAIHAEIPGVKKDDINVGIEGNQVEISAEVKNEKEVKEGERVLRSERYFGKVYRAFVLGNDIDESATEARYADGILELKLAKKAPNAAKRISIQ